MDSRQPMVQKVNNFPHKPLENMVMGYGIPGYGKCHNFMGIPVSHIFRHIPSLLPGATAKLAAVAEAQFESMFTEEAEKSKLDRDISQLSSAKRSVKTQTLAYFSLSNIGVSDGFCETAKQPI